MSSASNKPTNSGSDPIRKCVSKVVDELEPLEEELKKMLVTDEINTTDQVLTEKGSDLAKENIKQDKDQTAFNTATSPRQSKKAVQQILDRFRQVYLCELIKFFSIRNSFFMSKKFEKRQNCIDQKFQLHCIPFLQQSGQQSTAKQFRALLAVRSCIDGSGINIENADRLWYY